MTLNPLQNKSGQATVELAIVFPVVLIIACVAINAILFFSYCSKFDRIFKQTVCEICTSPAYCVTTINLKDDLQNTLNSSLQAENLEIETSVEGASGGLVKYGAKIYMSPTLFGLGLKSEIFGVPLFKLQHSQNITVDTYKPGVVF